MPENMEQVTAATNQQEEQRTFTQDEVTQIVQSRLARAKLDASNSSEFQQREAALNRRELELDAREALTNAGLPKELISAINCADKDTMLKSIKTLQSLYGSAGSAPASSPVGRYRVCTGTSNQSEGNHHRGDDADIRKAMGLKGR